MDRSKRIGWFFAAPGLVTLALVMGFPLVYGVLIAFSSFTLRHLQLAPFVGFDNFVAVFSDEYFRNSVWLTLKYSVATVTGEFLLGLGVALMLQRVTRFKAIYFAILTIPMAMSPVAVGLIWHMLLQPNLGIVNEVLKTWGLQPVDFLGTGLSGFWTLVAIDIWQQVSFVILILAAGLASLPKEPYEAAEVDGATELQQFWHITLPMLRPVAAIAIIIQLINEFRTYDLVYVLTRGGPGISTELLSFFAYKRAFLGLSTNEGAAASLVLLAMVLVLTYLFFRSLGRQDA